MRFLQFITTTLFTITHATLPVNQGIINIPFAVTYRSDKRSRRIILGSGGTEFTFTSNSGV